MSVDLMAALRHMAEARRVLDETEESDEPVDDGSLISLLDDRDRERARAENATRAHALQLEENLALKDRNAELERELAEARQTLARLKQVLAAAADEVSNDRDPASPASEIEE